MRVQVVYDSDGRILTAVPHADGDSQPTVNAVPQPGANVGHFDVPAEFEGKEFHDFMHLVKVDTATTRLIVTSDQRSS